MNSGKITLTDYYDATPVQSFLTADGNTKQLYIPNSQQYSPSYKDNPLTVTLKVFRSGSSVDVIDYVTDISWFYESAGNVKEITPSDAVEFLGQEHRYMKIKDNQVFGSGYATIIVTAVYNDPNTLASTPVKATMLLSVDSLSETGFEMNGYSENGQMFINMNPPAINLVGEIINQGARSSVPRRNYWFRKNSSVSKEDDSRYDSIAGLGWEKIDSHYTKADINVQYGDMTSETGCLSVKESDVVNTQTYMLIVRFEDDSIPDMRYITGLQSYDSPYTVDIQTTGTVFKNNRGFSDLRARVYNATDEIDTLGNFNYRWSAYDGEGRIINNFGKESPYRTGKTISVDASEIPETCNIKVDVTDES